MIPRLYSTAFERILSLEGEQFDAMEFKLAAARLDSIVISASARWVPNQALEDQVVQLNRIVFRHCSFRFAAASRSRDFTLTGTLLTGCGNCLGLTTLYLMIAQALQLPLVPLLYEGHMAAGIEKLGSVRPIEVSRRGMMPQGPLADLIYGNKGVARALTDEEFLAVHFSNHAAFVAVPRGDRDRALHLLIRAVRIFPGYVAAWINLAALLSSQGRVAGAKAALEKAFELTPSGPYLRRADVILQHLLSVHHSVNRPLVRQDSA